MAHTTGDENQPAAQKTTGRPEWTIVYLPGSSLPIPVSSPENNTTQQKTD